MWRIAALQAHWCEIGRDEQRAQRDGRVSKTPCGIHRIHADVECAVDKDQDTIVRGEHGQALVFLEVRI